MLQGPFSLFGVGHLPKICTPICTTSCMTVYVICRRDKAVEGLRKVATVKLFIILPNSRL